MSRFFIWTFGCRSNQADSAAIRANLSNLSMTESASWQDADLIVVNTCTVTHRSDKQVRQAIRRLNRENPRARIIVTGCYAQRDPQSAALLPGVSLVLGNSEKERLATYLPDSKKMPDTNRIFCGPLDAEAGCSLPPMQYIGEKTRPLVKLQDGCDARCSYCIVPQVRGPGRSARPEDVLAEIRSLVEHGFQEIVLTGVHLGAYGRRVKQHPRLLDLLQQILEIPRLGRIRLSSIEPMCFDRGIIQLAAESSILARHFHIPIQSGCDRILRLMRRPYTTSRFESLLKAIQKELPDAGLGTDVLVGFPGETEEDFAATCSLLESLPLSYMHVFPFSPREGTEAFTLPDKIPSQVMKHRLGETLRIAQSKNLQFRKRFIGQLLPAITLSKEENLGESVVLTSNYIHASVKNLSVPPNRLVMIRIDEVRPNTTYASIVE